MLHDLLDNYLIPNIQTFAITHDIDLDAITYYCVYSIAFIPIILLISDYIHSHKKEDPVHYFRKQSSSLSRTSLNSILIFPATIFTALMLLWGEPLRKYFSSDEPTAQALLLFWPIGFCLSIVVYFLLLLKLQSLQTCSNKTDVENEHQKLTFRDFSKDFFAISALALVKIIVISSIFFIVYYCSHH